MTFEELKDKALSLPYEPGVYIMRDKNDKVIYVGKARDLRRRLGNCRTWPRKKHRGRREASRRLRTLSERRHMNHDGFQQNGRHRIQ